MIHWKKYHWMWRSYTIREYYHIFSLNLNVFHSAMAYAIYISFLPAYSFSFSPVSFSFSLLFFFLRLLLFKYRLIFFFTDQLVSLSNLFEIDIVSFELVYFFIMTSLLLSHISLITITLLILFNQHILVAQGMTYDPIWFSPLRNIHFI